MSEQQKFELNLFVSVLSESTCGDLIAELVKLSYTVGPLSKSGKPSWTHGDNLVHVIGLRVVSLSDNEELIVIEKLIDDVFNIFKIKNMTYLSVVCCSSNSHCKWNVGNCIKESVPQPVGPYRTSAKLN